LAGGESAGWAVLGLGSPFNGALVTNNIKHFIGAGKRFGIQVLSPAAFLRMIWEGEQHGN
jgi:hypothetical protein